MSADETGMGQDYQEVLEAVRAINAVLDRHVWPVPMSVQVHMPGQEHFVFGHLPHPSLTVKMYFLNREFYSSTLFAPDMLRDLPEVPLDAVVSLLRVTVMHLFSDALDASLALGTLDVNSMERAVSRGRD